MKKIILLLFCLTTFAIVAQNKKITKTGTITFEASVPSFEEVKATNSNVSCILNTTTGEIAALALVKGFRFKVALMEEHFNENYAESTIYPKSIFKGTIEDFDLSKLTPKPKEFKIKGSLEFHGVKKDIIVTAYIALINQKIDITSHFILNSDDFNIKIPNVVSKKVSKEVNVDLRLQL